jgi:hypothetical protein
MLMWNVSRSDKFGPAKCNFSGVFAQSEFLLVVEKIRENLLCYTPSLSATVDENTVSFTETVSFKCIAHEVCKIWPQNVCCVRCCQYLEYTASCPTLDNHE